MQHELGKDSEDLDNTELPSFWLVAPAPVHQLMYGDGMDEERLKEIPVVVITNLENPSTLNAHPKRAIPQSPCAENTNGSDHSTSR